MENSIIAVAIIVVIAIILVAAYALSHHSAPSSPIGGTNTSKGSGNNTASTTIGSSSLSPGCTAPSGFSCANASVTTSGLVSLSFTNNKASSLYNVHIACIASAQAVNSSSWYSLSLQGTPKSANFGGTTIQADSEESIASVQCYTPTGAPASLSVGQNYQGTFLLNYTGSIGPVNATNPWITVKTAINLNAVGAST